MVHPLCNTYETKALLIGRVIDNTIVTNQNSCSISITNMFLNLYKYDFYIYKFDNKKILYKIIFNGSPDHFLKFMKNKNYEFDIQNKIWSIK